MIGASFPEFSAQVQDGLDRIRQSSRERYELTLFQTRYMVITHWFAKVIEDELRPAGIIPAFDYQPGVGFVWRLMTYYGIDIIFRAE